MSVIFGECSRCSGVLHVRGQRADHARQRPFRGMHHDALGQQHLRIHAADGVDPQEAVVVDEAHHQPDLVAVAFEHHRRAALRVDDGEGVAIGIG